MSEALKMPEMLLEKRALVCRLPTSLPIGRVHHSYPCKKLLNGLLEINHYFFK